MEISEITTHTHTTSLDRVQQKLKVDEVHRVKPLGTKLTQEHILHGPLVDKHTTTNHTSKRPIL